MIHVDTHVLVWVASGAHHRLPEALVRALPRIPIRYSPMLALELQLLHEIGRLTRPGHEVLERLRARLDLRPSEADFPRVASRATTLDWTRDPFDRLIAASAMVDALPLLTADRRMLASCPVAVWEAWG